jgi:2-polyprenyl-6-methoxyphenol hydroxylase-like FAD-dependent oxidoreductase
MIAPLSTWRLPSGKVVLIGDAAHAIPPSGGVGGAMAFEDAESLACALSKSEKDKSALQTWENLRKERVKQVVDFTNMVAKLRQASQYSLVQAIKESFIWGLLKVRGPEGYRWLYGYDAEIAMSKL